MKSNFFVVALVLGLTLSGVALAEETIKDGLVKEYYPNGKVKSEINYEKGIPSGLGKAFFEDGGLAQEILYVNGVNEHLKKIYYKSGELFQEVHLVNAKPVGDWKIYRPGGGLAHLVVFDTLGHMVKEEYYDEKGMVVKDGLWKGYDQEGNRTGPFTLKNGVRIEELEEVKGSSK